MAKMRTLKPEFWSNEELAEHPMGTRLFYMGLWNFADDNGVFAWRPKRLKAQIFPYDSINVEECLNNLIESCHVKQVEYEGKLYGVIESFADHQKTDRRYYKEIVPLHDVSPTSARCAPATEKKGKERKGKESREEVEAIINFLNSKLGSKYSSSTEKTVALISGRLKEGRSLEDFKAVIVKKVAEWRGTDYEKYLRPSTLFSPTNFENYLNQKNNEKQFFGEY